MGNSVEPLRELEEGGSRKESYKQKLLGDIRIEKNINILLVGQVQSGKSSYMNNIASICEGRISEVTHAGRNDRSVTRKLKPFTHKKLGNIKLFDTMGLEEGGYNGLSIKDAAAVVNGNIHPHYQFDPEEPADTKLYKTNPSIDDKIHCVVFVMDANVVGRDNISTRWKKTAKELQDAFELGDLPRIVLLTKIDVLCEEVKKNVTKTYESPSVKKAVDLSKQLFDLPDRNIFPVQNYSKEMEIDYRKDILTLLALRQMVYFAKDYMAQGSFDARGEEEAP